MYKNVQICNLVYNYDVQDERGKLITILILYSKIYVTIQQ